MKELIDGKIYDTESAEEIVRREFGLGTMTILYRTQKGNWFTSLHQLFGEPRLQPLSESEARARLLYWREFEVLEEYFGEQFERA